MLEAMAVRVISHFRVVRRLGTGGMGEVFLAQDTELDRPVALKIMLPELANDSGQRKRFRSEAKTASGLSHPHICIIHEVGETPEGRPFLAMEYIDGQTLEAILQQRRLSPGEIVKLGIDVAEALDAAHTQGIVHRDIKPANLMLNQRGEVKVLDFGLAKCFASEKLSAAATSVNCTTTGVLVGTPLYMSPEQVLGRALDPRADIFSLGAVLYELVAGQRPFLGDTVGEVANNVVNASPAPLGPEIAARSPALEHIILKCLQKEPDERYSSARQLAADLRNLQELSDRDDAAPPEPTVRIPVRPASNARGPIVLRRLAAQVGPAHKAALGWMLASLALALLAVGGWALLRHSGPKQPTPVTRPRAAVQQKSVAVLPFVNLSADKQDEYLSDGMTEELLNALARIPGLRVPGRSSSFAFKGRTEENIFQRVGEQLGVSAVVEGSVRKDGNQSRITAQLINVADGFHLWSSTYDRDMTNIFAIQSDIASRVAAALEVQLLGAPPEPTANIEAYKLYLQGRYFWNRRTGESLKQAIDFYDQAIAIDPAYALAYEGLANSYALLPIYGKNVSAEARTKTRQAALKALELDSRLAGPVAALAALKDGYDWDWEGAEADYRRAIALDPNYATARQWLAESLSMRGRSPEAVRQAREALALDPLSPMINAILGKVLLIAGQIDESIAVLRKQVALDPSFAPAHALLAWGYVSQGKLAEAIAELETVSRLDENNPHGELGFCYARAGRKQEAQLVLRQFLDFQASGRDLSVETALVYHGLGDDQQAFVCLERAVSEHSSQLQSLIGNPCWQDLRPHPRFQAILKRMNLVK